ncbi:MAG: hypothetical protein QXH03_02655 [Candidatus Bathyarchaeia archaeon]
MKLEKFAPIFALLLAVGIIFGAFSEFAAGGSFGWTWFLKMLWFVVGFVALMAIGLLLWALAQSAEAKITEEK